MTVIKKILGFFRPAWAVVRVAFKRLATQRFLSLAALSGLIVASGFIFSVPLYADATYFRLFRSELFAGNEAGLTGKPADYAPLAFTFNFQAVGRNSPQWKDAEKVNDYLSGDGQQAIGVPVLNSIRCFHTDGYFLYPPANPLVSSTQFYLTPARIAAVTPLLDAVEITVGTAPASFLSPMFGIEPVEALVSETLAQEYGIQVGDLYTLRRNNFEIPVRITGLWRPLDPAAPYWDNTSSTWLLFDEGSYTGVISEQLPDELRSLSWVITGDGSGLHAEDVAGLERHIQLVQEQANLLLPNTALVSSPLEALERYQKNVPSLTYLLFAFSVPILGMILTFIGLVTGLFVNQQRGEMAILRSRGASSLKVVGISMLQGLLLGFSALAGGILPGYLIAHAIGRARSFMDFSTSGGLRVSLTLSMIGYGLLGIGIILIFQFLLPTLASASATIITYKKERARMQRPPWWQRYWLDILLLLPAGYGFWLLQNESRRALAGVASAPDPLQNPLLLIAPAIGIFSAALFTLRLVPRMMALLSAILKPTKSVGLLMAARYLARTPAFYSAQLILLLLTLSLSAFTASLARTLDLHLEKQMYYQVGAELSIEEQGTNYNEGGSDAVYDFRPVDEHLGLQGVETVTRVGRYSSTAALKTGAVEGYFVGIDRLTFPGTAYWQRDFASRPLVSLMNELGANFDGVLIPTNLMKSEGLKIGDTFMLGVKNGLPGQSIPLKLRVVGSYDLFPTWYPSRGPFFVANLDYLYLSAGAEYPHDVWINTTPGTDPEDVVYGVRGYSIMLDLQADQSRLVKNGLNTFVKEWTSAEDLILVEQKRPERQGLFGLLSVGFIASALLTVLGFMLYALFSFRRRFIEMGMLRAIGLSVGQMVRLLAAELASLILLGIGAGTLLGILASQLFVPFLQIGADAAAQYPPFKITIAWDSILEIYGLFIVLFAAALVVLSTILVRMKIFQAVKLGETS
jgi:putative ABC transport system permease protein